MTKHKAGFCPHCGAELTGNYGQHKFYSNEIKFNWSCGKCGDEGQEVYKLIFVGHEVEEK